MVTPLWPTFPASLAQPGSTAPPKYGRAPAFDFITGDFKKDSQGRIRMNEGYRAWIEYGVKAVVVQRGAHMIYSDRYGVDLEGAFQTAVPGIALALLVNEIEGMLLADPRTATVGAFQFEETEDGGYLISWATSPTIEPSRSERVSVAINP